MNLPRTLLVLAALALALAGCGEATPTATVAVHNAFSMAQFTLVEVAYRDARWTTPLGLGAISADAEVEPGLGYVYALAVWTHDPATTPPQQPLVMRTSQKVEAIAGERVELVFSEPGHKGKCGGLSETEYDQIARDIFPTTAVQAYGSIDCGS